jgi:hypothetical protein
MLRIWSLTIICLVFAAASIVPGHAQDIGGPIVVAQAEKGGLFRSLFGKKRKVKRGADIRRQEQPKSQARTKKRRTKTRSAGSSKSRPAVVAATKSENAKQILVVGDFMANALAKGLSDAFATNPDIVVINANNGASGLVRDDYYNWPLEMPKLVVQHKPSIVLAMVGANDRQAIRSTAGQITVNSDAWRAAYEAKVAAFADTLAAQNVPIVWLSLVPVGSPSLSRDYSVFNSLYRQKAELKGLNFADVWNGFADDKGGYVASGPDINGQNRQLRAGDGLNFTKAGRRKLAFFVEREVARLLDDNQSSIFAGLTDPGADPNAPALAPSLPAIGPMVPIDAVSIRPGSELSTAPAPKKAEPQTDVAANAAEEPRDKPKAIKLPPPGRADNFSWPAPQ